MNISKETLRKKLEVALNSEVSTNTEDKEVIVIDDDYQTMLDRIVNFITRV